MRLLLLLVVLCLLDQKQVFLPLHIQSAGLLLRIWQLLHMGVYGVTLLWLGRWIDGIPINSTVSLIRAAIMRRAICSEWFRYEFGYGGLWLHLLVLIHSHSRHVYKLWIVVCFSFNKQKVVWCFFLILYIGNYLPLSHGIGLPLIFHFLISYIYVILQGRGWEKHVYLIYVQSDIDCCLGVGWIRTLLETLSSVWWLLWY